MSWPRLSADNNPTFDCPDDNHFTRLCMDNHRTFTAVRHKEPDYVQVNLVVPMSVRAVNGNFLVR
jgi:hypothetical protein